MSPAAVVSSAAFAVYGVSVTAAPSGAAVPSAPSEVLGTSAVQASVPRAPGQVLSSAAPAPAAVRSDCWAPPTPLHLARLEGEWPEEHILRGLD
ncbi:hypothetical protein [Streptomyces sp. NPDC047000]|uniref:hypothetical protein n=1 Tax=Streptomyces sp. NPDC047000 TaxID=3155474 RepID=UPI0033E2E97F